MNNTFISTIELLENDHSGQAYKELKEEIFNITIKVKRHLDSGLSSDEANNTKKILEASQSADNVLNSLYEIFKN